MLSVVFSFEIAHSSELMWSRFTEYKLFSVLVLVIRIEVLISYKAEPFTLLPSVSDGRGTNKTASNPKIINILRRAKEH